MSIQQAEKNVYQAHRYVAAELRNEQACQALRLNENPYPQLTERIAQAQVRIEALTAAEAALRLARDAFAVATKA